MGARRGRAVTRRGRAGSYAKGLVRVIAAGCIVALAPAGLAGAQSTGGASPEAPSSAPRLSAPPPGVKVRPAPVLRSWRCVRACQDTISGSTGSLVRVRGRALWRTYEVVFLGADGRADRRGAGAVAARFLRRRAAGPRVLRPARRQAGERRGRAGARARWGRGH